MKKILNDYLADTVVLYHKLQNFHWYAKGKGFYSVHEQIEEYFNGLLSVIDDVAEGMLMREIKPMATLREFLEVTKITEYGGDYINGRDIYTHVLRDFEYMQKHSIMVKEKADKEEMYLFSAMMDNFINQYAKAIWMMKAELAEL